MHRHKYNTQDPSKSFISHRILNSTDEKVGRGRFGALVDDSPGIVKQRSMLSTNALLPAGVRQQDSSLKINRLNTVGVNGINRSRPHVGVIESAGAFPIARTAADSQQASDQQMSRLSTYGFDGAGLVATTGGVSPKRKANKEPQHRLTLMESLSPSANPHDNAKCKSPQNRTQQRPETPSIPLIGIRPVERNLAVAGDGASPLASQGMQEGGMYRLESRGYMPSPKNFFSRMNSVGTSGIPRPLATLQLHGIEPQRPATVGHVMIPGSPRRGMNRDRALALSCIKPSNTEFPSGIGSPRMLGGFNERRPMMPGSRFGIQINSGKLGIPEPVKEQASPRDSGNVVATLPPFSPRRGQTKLVVSSPASPTRGQLVDRSPRNAALPTGLPDFKRDPSPMPAGGGSEPPPAGVKGKPTVLCAYCGRDLRGWAKCMHPYWPEIIMCESCSSNLQRCFGCERKAVPFTDVNGDVHECSSFPNDVVFCGICQTLETIHLPNQVRQLQGEVLHFLANRLNIVFTSEMLQEQHRAKVKEARGDAEGAENAQLNKSGDGTHQTDPSAPRARKARNAFDDIAVICWDATQFGNINTNGVAITHFAKGGQCHMRKLRKGQLELRVVDSVTVVKGLPRPLFGANLCHELLHAYWFLSKYQDLLPEVEEGLCNALSLLYLKNYIKLLEAMQRQGCYEVPRTRNSPRYRQSVHEAKARQRLLNTKEVCEFMVRKLYKNNNPIYGEGFRKAIAAVEILGLPRTLRHVIYAGMLPKMESGCDMSLQDCIRSITHPSSLQVSVNG